MQDFVGHLVALGVVADASTGTEVDAMAFLSRCEFAIAPDRRRFAIQRFSDRVRAEAARTLRALEPFLSELDARAFALMRSGYAKRLPGTVHDMLDPAFDPATPLLTALSWEPLLRDTMAGVSASDPDRFRAAVAHGRDAVRAMLRDHLRATLVGVGDVVGACVRVVRSLSTLPVRDVALVAAALDRNWSPVGYYGDPVPGRWTPCDVVAGVEVLDTAVRAAVLLADLPPNWTPADTVGWTSLAACASAVSYARHVAGPDAAPRFLDAKGDWADLHRRLADAHGHVLSQALDDVDDMVASWERQVLQPAIDLSGRPGVAPVPGTALTLLASGRTLRTVLDASRRWHEVPADRLTRHAARTAQGDVVRHVRSWPRAWPDATRDGVTVSELTDAAALDDEGGSGADQGGLAGLAHCVGDYWTSCMSGESRILSLRRSSDGLRLSTAEVGIDAGLPYVVQHRGRANAEPDEASVTVLAAYLRDVLEGRLNVDMAALEPIDVPQTSRAGYDADLPGAWEAVRDNWAPYVPRGLGRVTARRLAHLCDAMRERGDAGRWRPESVAR